jgi:ribosomal protein S17E
MCKVIANTEELGEHAENTSKLDRMTIVESKRQLNRITGDPE